MPFYFDNAATTQVLPAVAEVVGRTMTQDYGNPSSVHGLGLAAERIVEAARAQLARAVGAQPAQVVFTSGGTEANNLALKGAAAAAGRRRHLITTPIEHPSVLAPLEALRDEGFELSLAPVDGGGRIELEALLGLVRDDTALVSVGLVNNELGTLQPLAELARRLKARKRPPLLHTDAVQALGKTPLDWSALGVDLMSVSAHKIHGPKGCGALIVRPGLRLAGLIMGGGQERGLRSGTLNVPGIAGFGAALAALADDPRRGDALGALRDRMWRLLAQSVPDLVRNTPEESAPHILNLSVSGVRGEVLVRALGEAGVFASTGSACSSRSAKPSHVLSAVGLRGAALEGSLRLSFGALNTEHEIEPGAEIIARTIASLRALSG